MSDFLQQMAGLSAERAALARPPASCDLDKPVVPLDLASFDVIAEIKDRSPSEGALAGPARSRLQQADLYRHGGAAAISVLTEPSRFAGDLAHLEEVAAHSNLPVMRKDFLVETVQILEARAAGASGVLLIVAMLDDAKLLDMLECAWDHSLFVLLESFDKEDLRRSDALLKISRHSDKARARELLVGINTRNLRTLEVDGHRLGDLAQHLPAGASAVAESGLRTPDDAAAARRMGYEVALVGSALMRSDDPRQLLGDMLSLGRAA